jgi:hypothetical protein
MSLLLRDCHLLKEDHFMGFLEQLAKCGYFMPLSLSRFRVTRPS